MRAPRWVAVRRIRYPLIYAQREVARSAAWWARAGPGFPTYVKAQSQVEFVIANGAECEPLIHKDAEMMKHFPG